MVRLPTRFFLTATFRLSSLQGVLFSSFAAKQRRIPNSWRPSRKIWSYLGKLRVSTGLVSDVHEAITFDNGYGHCTEKTQFLIKRKNSMFCLLAGSPWAIGFSVDEINEILALPFC